jgi:hypothetical protein
MKQIYNDITHLFDSDLRYEIRKVGHPRLVPRYILFIQDVLLMGYARGSNNVKAWL